MLNPTPFELRSVSTWARVATPSPSACRTVACWRSSRSRTRRRDSRISSRASKSMPGIMPVRSPSPWKATTAMPGPWIPWSGRGAAALQRQQPQAGALRGVARRRPHPLGGRAPHRGAEGEGEGGRPLEPVPARQRTRRRPHQPRIRAALGGDGPGGLGERGLQLLGPRHRQHGDPGALRVQRAEGGVTGAAARRPHAP